MNQATTAVLTRDGLRFAFFLALPLATRERWIKLYTTPRALRTAIDNAMRDRGLA